MPSDFALTTTLRHFPPFLQGVNFIRIKRLVLGKKYELSLVFIGNARSRTLNLRYRHKDKPTNVLAFPLSKSEGELFITLPFSIREATLCAIPPSEHITRLFIHGLLHLKGFQHGATMEQEEKRLVKKFLNS